MLSQLYEAGGHQLIEGFDLADDLLRRVIDVLPGEGSASLAGRVLSLTVDRHPGGTSARKRITPSGEKS